MSERQLIAAYALIGLGAVGGAVWLVSWVIGSLVYGREHLSHTDRTGAGCVLLGAGIVILTLLGLAIRLVAWVAG